MLELLAQQIGDVQARVGVQQPFEIGASIGGQIFAARQQHVALALDEAAILAGDAFVFRAPHHVERVGQMFHDVEFVEQDGGLRRVAMRRVAKGFPHVHHGEAYFFGVFIAQKRKKQIHVRFAAPGSAKPDRAPRLQIADDNAIAVAFPDRDLIDANDAWFWRSSQTHLLAHVDFVEVFDGVPIQMHQPRHVLDRHRAAQAADLRREPQAVFCVLRQKRQLLVFDAAGRALHAAHLEIEINFPVAATEIARPPPALVVESAAGFSAAAANGFFERRSNVRTSAGGSCS